LIAQKKREKKKEKKKIEFITCSCGTPRVLEEKKRKSKSGREKTSKKKNPEAKAEGCS
jgi:hypothetical protein